MLEETAPAGERLGLGGDKRGVVVGNGELKDVVPNVEPVRSHAGINMVGCGGGKDKEKGEGEYVVEGGGGGRGQNSGLFPNPQS